MHPLGFNLTSVSYYNPCPFLDQAWVGQRGRASASTSSILVPFSSQSHNYTLITDPSVRSVKVGGVAVPFANGRATFDYKGSPGHGTTVALNTTIDPPISIVRTDWLALRDQGEIFSPDFLDCVAGSAGFRFMDWAHTNDTTLTAWTPKDAPSFNNVMVPVEHKAALCSKLGAAMWLNIPASIPLTEAVRVVKLARSLLTPGLKLHVEWSNEVWNTGMPIGKIAAMAPGGSAAFYGQKSAALAGGLKGVAGVDVVLCWQYTSSVASKQKVIDAYKAAGGDMAMLGGFGIAPYAWNSTATVNSYLTNNDGAGLMADLATNQQKYAYKMAETVKWASGLGLKTFFYESGLQANTYGTAQADFAAIANHADASGPLFRKIMDDADAAGVSERYAFTSAAARQFGFWPDYDTDPYPIGEAWRAYNRRAWPLSTIDRSGK